MFSQSLPRILLTPFLLVFSMVQAIEIHVDQKSQSAVENGSFETPFKTIAQASALLNPGDVCVIHNGIYREELTPTNSGQEGAPITYIAYGQDKVVITATETVTGWEIHEGSIYKTSEIEMSLGDSNMVYHNSAAQQIARWPNDLDGNPFTFDAFKIKTTEGSYSDSFISHDDIPDYWTDGVVFWLGAHGGCAVQRRITGFNSESKRLSFTPFPSRWPFGTHSPMRWENGHRGQFFLMNKLEALDANGEWFWDNATAILYYMAPDGKIPTDGAVEYAARERSLRSFQDHVVYRNLNFFGAPVQLNGNHQTLDRCRIKNGVNSLITDGESATDGGAAVFIYGSNVSIENSLIEEGSASGINIGMSAADAVVKNCIVRNFDKQGNHCAPIRSSGPRALITNNKFCGSARDCTRVTGDDSIFAFNDVSNALLGCQDGGLFYVTGQSIPKNITLHHNWFYNAYSPDYTGGKATGIYLDNDSAGYLVHHNVVWNAEWGALHFNWDALENQIYNNSFWNVGYNSSKEENWAAILCWVPERNGVRTNVRDNTLINNLSDTRAWWDSGAGDFRVDETLDNTFINNSQASTSPFIDFRNQVFEPTAGHAIVDSGQILEGINDTFIGAAPDIGAYEAGGIRWKPGPDWIACEFDWFSTNEVYPSKEVILVNDFVVTPGRNQFGVVETGTIELKSSEAVSAILDYNAKKSPFEIDFEWKDLSLDENGVNDDSLSFTLVVTGNENGAQTYLPVQMTNEGWGVNGGTIHEDATLCFVVKNVTVHEQTAVDVKFGGFTGVQAKRITQNETNGEAAIYINDHELSFQESDTKTNPRGMGFLWPLREARISNKAESGAEFVVSALNFQFVIEPKLNTTTTSLDE